MIGFTALFTSLSFEKMYLNFTGRGSGSPSMDVFITLLHLGSKGYVKLLNQRKVVFNYLKERLKEVASKHGERLLVTPNNPISVGE